MATVETPARDGALAPVPPREHRVRRREWFLPAYTAAVIGYLFLPIVVMVMFGFNDYQGRFNVTWQGFTLRWYRTIFAFPDLNEALKNSLMIATVSMLAATIIGSLMALALTRYRFRGRPGVNMFVFVPMATPEVVLGVSLLSLFLALGLTRGTLTIVLAHIMFSISYVVVTVKARTSGLDRNHEDAAQDLGATPWTAFWTVTFPAIFPGILAAGLLAFVLSIDDYVITSFNAGETSTLPIWIYGASRLGVPAQVNVIGTAILTLGIVYVLINVVRGQKGAEIPPPLLKKG